MSDFQLHLPLRAARALVLPPATDTRSVPRLLTGRPQQRVVAVVVTHEPAGDVLAANLRSALQQVQGIVLVDNGSRQPPVVPHDVPVQAIRLSINRGLGTAQNLGIRAALAQGADFVLLLDQDSRPGQGMVQALLQALTQAQEGGLRVAAVGPCIVDAAGQCDGFVRFRNGRYEALSGAGDAAGAEWIDCDLVIASGSLLPATALAQVGLMAEELFIDKVDTEWCLRAAATGWHLIGAPRAALHHRLGERTARVWFLRWRELRVHKPFRYYYMVRNSLLLRRAPHRTAAWCRADLRQLCSLFLYFGLLLPNRGAALRMMLRGLFDGWRQVSGPLR